MEITFTVMGNVLQHIRLIDNCPYSEDEIVDALNGVDGKCVLTTIQVGGSLIEMGDDGSETILGTVMSVELEDIGTDLYADFERKQDD